MLYKNKIPCSEEPHKMVEHITHDSELLALILSNKFKASGTHFITPSDFSQQLAYMHHPAGKVIEPHIHKLAHREVQYTQEVLLIKSGKMRVDFYGEEQQYLESRVLEKGDVILLIKGGHGFEVLEELEMIEVKQGPYLGEQDKLRFKGISLN